MKTALKFSPVKANSVFWTTACSNEDGNFYIMLLIRASFKVSE
jgi:hypothetical protein